MYFIPEKGRFYRWAVHTRPLYRYGITIGILGALLALWFFLLNPWLIGMVQYEQAALNRAVQEKQDACTAERTIAHNAKLIEKVDGTIQEITRAQAEQNPVAFLFDAAQKDGLQIDAFSKEKENRTEWLSKQEITLTMNGALAQFLSFFANVAQSSLMIECKQFGLHATDPNRYSGSFQLVCVSLTS